MRWGFLCKLSFRGFRPNARRRGDGHRPHAAVAARIEGTTIWNAARRDGGDTLRLAMPSGVLTVGAEVRHGSAAWQANRGSFHRTARRLFEGYVYA